MPEIREFFWKWRRSHHPDTESNLIALVFNSAKKGEVPMRNIGIFGHLVEQNAASARPIKRNGLKRRADLKTGCREPKALPGKADVARDRRPAALRKCAAKKRRPAEHAGDGQKPGRRRRCATHLPIRPSGPATL